MDMLMDYASDDDDDDQPAAPSSSSPMLAATPIAAPPAPLPSLLPSAAHLFDSPESSASPSSSSLPRKRPQVNGSAHPSHPPKVSRSTTSSSGRTPPGSTLVPPQLRGRSNVATEDLDKLFVQRQQRRSE